MNSAEYYLIPFDTLREFCRRAYLAVGVPPDEAQVVADLLARADLRGVASHGVMRLPIYIERLEKGYARRRCLLETLRRRGATAHLAAHGSLGHVVAVRAMELAVQLCREHGIGWVTVKDSGHFGVAGLLAMQALEHDFIGYVCSNSAPMMAPFGGRQRIIGNNPLAYAFPTLDRPPVVVDFSCSVVASGRLILARKKGERIPLGWAVDPQGRPTEDPYLGYEGGGSLAPVGGHKGYGLALAHEMLTALLGGGKWSAHIRSLYQEEPGGVQGTCHGFMVLDPDCFVGRRRFKEELDRYIDFIKSSGTAAGVDEILLPGEPEHRSQERNLRRGVPLAAPTARELVELGRRLEIELKFPAVPQRE